MRADPGDVGAAIAANSFYALKTPLRALGPSLLDRRTTLGKRPTSCATSAATTQQLALVDLAVRSKLLVDSVDAYVLSMPSPVNRQRRCLHPVVRERQALVGQLQSLLRDRSLSGPSDQALTASLRLS